MKTITLGLPLFCWHLVSRVLLGWRDCELCLQGKDTRRNPGKRLMNPSNRERLVTPERASGRNE
ncbi:hypothetical protein FYZ45_08915 [Mobiluncus mulieris]|uniref:Secreted protein n=1 Tax=Mobiluncus mulieris TaxID=2052 RepID=A0ABD4TYQ8_9ACTO|nr:hypothetical protein [Mobiluncus mulieris]MCU9974042.1 hypothetical protein [Mobiluncus mulieris]MCU9994360.1 hypothetical protein [Mobiluncus mulieris]MCV0010037.1 hypothetical protein [Mobiluncus mulieris]